MTADPLPDWTKAPWFLEPKALEELWGHRYEEQELRDASAALAVLYPATFCQQHFEELRKNGLPTGVTDLAMQRRRRQEGFARLLAGLYGRPPGIVMELLHLGVDLATVLPDTPPKEWLNRLRDPGRMLGAEFELQIWANAKRAGFDIRRVPERQDRKTPDFIAAWRNWKLAIEAKDMATSEADMMFWDDMSFIHPRKSVPSHRAYHVEAADEIRALISKPEGRERYRSTIGGVQRALQRELDRVVNAGWVPGEYVIPEGRVVIEATEPGDGPGLGSSNMVDQMSPIRRAQRL